MKSLLSNRPHPTGQKHLTQQKDTARWLERKATRRRPTQEQPCGHIEPQQANPMEPQHGDQIEEPQQGGQATQSHPDSHTAQPHSGMWGGGGGVTELPSVSHITPEMSNRQIEGSGSGLGQEQYHFHSRDSDNQIILLILVITMLTVSNCQKFVASQ